MNDVEEIKSRLEVADVVGSYVQLKQSGRNLKAPCPFHHEKTASFMVSPEKGIWHCFGCGEGGDIFKFIMKIEGLDFRGALEMLAKRAGVELKNVKVDGGQAKARKRALEAHEWAVKFFQANLIRNKSALDYVVQKRRLGKQIITDFQIGYAPESWDGLVKALRTKGFTDAELVQAGLAGSRTGGRGIFDQFRGRIMFTICDATGQPVGFTGRVLGDELPKYLNTPQTLLYDKSRVVFGLHLAKEAIRKNDRVVLVEGNMDVIASHQAGVKEVVAASGTALTLEQLKALSYLSKNVLLAFDDDRAGLAAAERSIPLAQKLGLNLFIVDLNDEAKDADELIQKDPKLWKAALDNAKELRQYWLDKSMEQFNIKRDPTGIEKVRFIERMAAILRLYDNTTQAVFISDIASATGIEVETMQAALNEKPVTNPLKSPSKNAVQKTKKPPKIAGRPMLEDAILGLNLAFPEARLSMEDLDVADFESEDARAVVVYLQGDGHDQVALDIAQHLPDLSDYVKILTLRGEEQYGSFAPADRSFEAFMLTRRLQTIGSKVTKHQLTAELQAAEAAGDSQLVKTLLAKYQALISEE
jgi:DNA primase